MICPKCYAEVYTTKKNKTCPVCGERLNKKARTISIGVFLLFAFLLFVDYNKFSNRYSPSTIESKSSSMNFMEVIEYASSLKGESIQWKCEYVTPKYMKNENIFSISAKIREAENLTALFDLQYENGKKIKKNTPYTLVGNIDDVHNLLGVTMVRIAEAKLLRQ
jgi:hypothetical protein